MPPNMRRNCSDLILRQGPCFKIFMQIGNNLSMGDKLTTVRLAREADACFPWFYISLKNLKEADLIRIKDLGKKRRVVELTEKGKNVYNKILFLRKL